MIEPCQRSNGSESTFHKECLLAGFRLDYRIAAPHPAMSSGRSQVDYRHPVSRRHETLCVPVTRPVTIVYWAVALNGRHQFSVKAFVFACICSNSWNTSSGNVSCVWHTVVRNCRYLNNVFLVGTRI
ncbi:unnamed protein product [Aphis gossypii]|uniref:Uncharacterized protein n=1 Tax=Aphis gossypii TaxID=80765 RepID=A0A9P0NSK5_APHGO|nr:unnamed protein product [Aphis gossypii]